MRDTRRVFIPDPGPQSSDGFWKIASWIFCGVMIIALLDRGLTVAWDHASLTARQLLSIMFG